MLGPVIEGERVRLEPLAVEMAPLFCAWFADMEVSRYLGRIFPPGLKMEEEWLENQAKRENDVTWAIVVEGRPIGSTGIHQIDWKNRHGETGTVIGEKGAWGKGYASETIRLRTRFAFENLGLEKLMTQVFMENTASRRALEKAGYRQYGILRRHEFRHGRWHDMWLGEVLREEWLEAEGV